MPIRRSDREALWDIRRLFYETEASDSYARDSKERASEWASEPAHDVLDDTDAGNTYVYPSTFGRKYIFPLVSAHTKQLHSTWVVDFDWLSVLSVSPSLFLFGDEFV